MVYIHIFIYMYLYRYTYNSLAKAYRKDEILLLKVVCF